MTRKANDIPGYQPPPSSAGQWMDEFTRSKTINIPKLRTGETRLEVEDIAVPPCGTRGDPDLLVRTNTGKQFYVRFFTNENRIYYPLDLPVLYFPVDKGTVGSFWVVKDEYSFRLNH